MAELEPGEIVATPPVADPQPPAVVAEPAPRAQEPVVEIARIPLVDHQRVVDGFHSRLDEVSWAKGYKREDVEEALLLRRQLQERAKVSDEPQPDVLDEHRQPYYSPQQAAKWAEWKAAAMATDLERKLGERFAPILEAHEATQRQTEDLMGQIHQARGWKDFDTHIVEITKAITDAAKAGTPMSLSEAYYQVRNRVERATLESDIRKQVLADINKADSVISDINPARLPAGARKDRTKMTDAELWADVQDEVKAKSSAA